MFKHLHISLRGFDFNKLGKNIVGAIVTPAVTAFATTGDMAQAKHAAVLGVGAAALIVLGFIQQPYKTPQSSLTAPIAPEPLAPAPQPPVGE